MTAAMGLGAIALSWVLLVLGVARLVSRRKPPRLPKPDGRCVVHNARERW